VKVQGPCALCECEMAVKVLSVTEIDERKGYTFTYAVHGHSRSLLSEHWKLVCDVLSANVNSLSRHFQDIA